jgi:hypothetical protein
MLQHSGRDACNRDKRREFASESNLHEQSGVSEFSILEEVSDENIFGLLYHVRDHPVFICFWDRPGLCSDTRHPAHILPPAANGETSPSRARGYGHATFQPVSGFEACPELPLNSAGYRDRSLNLSF